MGLKVERYERIVLYATVVVLVFAFAAVVVSVVESNIHLPDDYQTIDPAAVAETAPFDAPGVYQIGENEYEAVVIAQAFAFTPSEIRIPAGSTVTFLVTSVDVTHGFMIPRTVINGMVIPGHITKLTADFDEPGEHTIVCHEFCGIGHHAMFGKVVVEG
jgi:cytochrome c oxidase subunit 2